MPNYDLLCRKCNQEHNIHATMAEKAKNNIPCPNCGSLELETLFKAPPAYVKRTHASTCGQRGRCGSSCPHAG